MSFRDDHEALLSRAEALDQECGSLRERLADTERQLGDAAAARDELHDEVTKLRAIADPALRLRDRKIVGSVALIVGSLVTIPIVLGIQSCASRLGKAHVPADAAIPDAAVDAAVAIDAPRDIGDVPLRVDQVKGGRFWPEGGWSTRIYYTVTRLRALPEGTTAMSKLTCEVGDQRRVEANSIALPGPPVGIGEGGGTYVDYFVHATLDSDPTRCELFVYVQMPGANPHVIDHAIARYCLTIDGPAKQQKFIVAEGTCWPKP